MRYVMRYVMLTSEISQPYKWHNALRYALRYVMLTSEISQPVERVEV
jgi:hypothetical protein